MTRHWYEPRSPGPLVNTVPTRPMIFLSKIINRNNVKNNYSCTNDISKIIFNHNNKLIEKLDENNNNISKQYCNGKIKKKCDHPVGNNYNPNNIIYQTIISTKEADSNKKKDLNRKLICHNHLQSFKIPVLKKLSYLSTTGI